MLLPINLSYKYSCVFGTIGPVKEQWGPDILAFITQYWEGIAIPHPDMPFRLKFETSNEGYTHFHLALMFTERVKFSLFIRRLQKYMSRYKNDKPPPYSKDKEFSIRLFQVPCKDTINGNTLRGPALINHYLDNPTKEKSTDGENFVVELDGFNVGHYITSIRNDASRFSDRGQSDLAKSYNDWADRTETFAKKYIKYAKSHDMPSINLHIVGNMPDLHQCEQTWHFQRLRSEGRCANHPDLCKFCHLGKSYKFNSKSQTWNLQK